jgi:hypothetical protein
MALMIVVAKSALNGLREASTVCIVNLVDRRESLVFRSITLLLLELRSIVQCARMG